MESTKSTWSLLHSNLTKQQNGFKITLKTLEDNLLSRLSSASGNFLGDTELVENLEITKRTAAEIEEKVKEAKVTETKINEAREHYRPAAARASLLYFIMNDLNKIHPMYQFALKAFSVVFQKAILKAAPDEVLKQRVLNLIDSITFSVFQYTTRGLFECDKLTYMAQLAFQILVMNKEINTNELDFLLRYPVQPGVTSPVDFLSHHSWGGIKPFSGSQLHTTHRIALVLNVSKDDAEQKFTHLSDLISSQPNRNGKYITDAFKEC
ncbi:dynein heavy chain 9, axonemal [Tachysurus ichikawai]